MAIDKNLQEQSMSNLDQTRNFEKGSDVPPPPNMTDEQYYAKQMAQDVGEAHWGILYTTTDPNEPATLTYDGKPCGVLHPGINHGWVVGKLNEVR